MNQNQDPSLAPRPLSQESFTAVNDAIKSLLSMHGRALLGEEEAGNAQVTGLQCVLEVPGLASRPGTVTIALYNEEAREQMTDFIRSAGVEVEEPIGHIKLGKEHKGVSLDGELYLEKNGRITGSLDCRIGEAEDTLQDSSDACLAFANGMGVGEAWERFWASGLRQQTIPVEFDDSMAAPLTELLESFRDQDAS